MCVCLFIDRLFFAVFNCSGILHVVVCDILMLSFSVCSVLICRFFLGQPLKPHQ